MSTIGTMTQKEDQIQRNVALMEQIKEGSEIAMQRFICINEMLLHRLCNTIKWQRYDTAEYDDVYNVAVISMMESIQSMLNMGYAMDSSPDFYKLYLETSSRLKAHLAEEYYNGGIFIPYSTQKYVVRTGQVSPCTESLDNGSDENVSKMNTLAANCESPEETVLHQQQIDDLARALSRLTPELRNIIAKRYGITGAEPMRLREVAKALHKTVSNVYYMEQKALTQLQEMIG